MAASQETWALVLFHHYLGNLKIPEYHFSPMENDRFGLDSTPSWKSLLLLKLHDSIFCNLWIFSLHFKLFSFQVRARLGATDLLNLEFP